MLRSAIPLWQIVLRTTVIYFVVLIGLRIFGKRQLGQMSIGDLAMILLIANAVQNAMVGPDTSLIGGITAAVTLLVVNVVVVRTFARSQAAERFFGGAPTLLIKDGNYVTEALHHEGLAREEVEMAIREHGIADASGVRVAYLEPDGTISVVPMGQKVMRGTKKVQRIRQFKRS